MSKPPPDNPELPDDDLVADDDPSLPVREIAEGFDDDWTDGDGEEDEEEFSLDQLSKAYAEVLRSQGSEAGETQDETAVESKPVDQSSPSEPASAADESTAGPPAERDFDASDLAAADNAGCPISPASIVEAILFVGAPKDVKLNSRKVAAVLRDVSPKEVTKIVRDLNKRYEKEKAAYRIKSDGGVFEMILAPELIEFQQDFFGRNKQVRLSQASIDVMAIVAYNQPVTKEQVDKIRLKPSGSILAQLVRRELLYIEPGETDPKVKYYSTTDRFLDLFQLEEIADLPQSHDISDIEELAD